MINSEGEGKSGRMESGVSLTKRVESELTPREKIKMRSLIMVIYDEIAVTRKRWW